MMRRFLWLLLQLLSAAVVIVDAEAVEIVRAAPAAASTVAVTYPGPLHPAAVAAASAVHLAIKDAAAAASALRSSPLTFLRCVASH